MPQRNLWRTWWCIRLLPQDPGSGRTQRTSIETAALLPSPAVGAEVDIQADAKPFSPLLSPCSHPSPLSPSSSLPLSLCLPACLPALAPYTGQDHNGPGWLMVTMVLTVSSHPQLSAALLLCPLPLFPQHCRNPKTHQQSPLHAAQNCPTTMEGVSPAVRVH